MGGEPNDDLPPLPASSTDEERLARYEVVRERLAAWLEGETDWTAALATTAAELHHAFAFYHWTGWYLTATTEEAPAEGADVTPRWLVVGPYQGAPACLRIPFTKGVCGAAALRRETQLVPDVHAFPGHIACASSTLSELVVPLLGTRSQTLAVLDVDSDLPAAFRRVDAEALEDLCAWLSRGDWAPRG